METMTTMKLQELGITLDVSDEVIEAISAAEKFSVTEEDIKKMSQDERHDLLSKASDVMDAWYYDNITDKALYEAADACYWRIHAVNDEEYREANMKPFKEYEARMNEPDFDWGYYSDWHKDMFGYRPHYKVIPVTEEARQELFETFHAARGL